MTSSGWWREATSRRDCATACPSSWVRVTSPLKGPGTEPQLEASWATQSRGTGAGERARLLQVRSPRSFAERLGDEGRGAAGESRGAACKIGQSLSAPSARQAALP